MKIEKINDTQMRFVLTKKDLEKKSLKIDDLAYGSSKTQELFQDIIEIASKEFSFNIEDTPLMIEAVPTSKTSIMILLTKVPNPITYQESSGIFKTSMGQKEMFSSSDLTRTKNEKKQKNVRRILKNTNNGFIMLCYEDFETLISSSKRIDLKCSSQVYKYNDKYYLVLQLPKASFDKLDLVESILLEYSQQVYGNEKVLLAYFRENGETIIKSKAIEILKKM